jgi:hypothetical protein
LSTQRNCGDEVKESDRESHPSIMTRF